MTFGDIYKVGSTVVKDSNGRVVDLRNAIKEEIERQLDIILGENAASAADKAVSTLQNSITRTINITL